MLSIKTNNDIKILCIGLVNSNVSNVRGQNRQFLYINATYIECIIFEG